MEQLETSVETADARALALAWLDEVQELVIHVDPAWRIVHANRPLLAGLGLRLEDLRGRDAFEVFAPYGVLFGDEARQAMQERTPSTRRAMHPPSGRWVETRFLPGPAGLTVCTRDVTAEARLEEQVEARTRQQASVARLGQFALTGPPLAGLLQRAAEELGQVLGYEFTALAQAAGGEELVVRAGVGWQAGTVGSGRLRATQDSPAGLALRTRQPVIVEDMQADPRFQASPLTQRHGIRSGVAVPIAPGAQPWGLVAVMARDPRPASGTDIHYVEAVAHLVATAIERDQREAELRRHRDELERTVAERTRELADSLRELESFSYSVSHDLRTSLRGIAAFAELLELRHRDTMAAEAQALLGNVRLGTRQMATLLEDLLALSRATRTPLVAEAVDLSALATTILQRQAQRPGLSSLTFEVAPGLVAWVQPGLAAALLENLLDNACKFSAGRAVPPRVEVGERPDGAIFVRDNGVGFPPEEGHKLFQPFSRLHGSAFEGTGIGLATVARIVRRHGGAVGAESRPGEGATFWFTLPKPHRPEP
jgi:signal transduction histidine kinase